MRSAFIPPAPSRLIRRVDGFFKSRREGDVAATQTARLLIRLYQAMMRIRAEAAKRYDLTHSALLSLIILRACHPDETVTPSELREAVMVTSGGMTKVLNTLEKRALVRRRPHPTDARSTILSLSDAGVALIDELLPLVNSMDRELFLEPLTAGEVAELMRLLGKLDAAAGAL